MDQATASVGWQRRLFIAAKAPRPGLVKTRLGAAIGATAAADLYGAFLQDLGSRFPDAGWYVTPADGWAEVEARVGGAPDAGVLIQPEGDWCGRQRHLFRHSLATAGGPVVLLASDSPQLTEQYVAAAFDALRDHDLVLGPTEDGGYALIGLAAWHDVLTGVEMSTGNVLEGILGNARALGLRVQLLAPTFDIDEAGDLAQLRAALRGRSDLPATATWLGRRGGLADVA